VSIASDRRLIEYQEIRSGSRRSVFGLQAAPQTLERFSIDQTHAGIKVRAGPSGGTATTSIALSVDTPIAFTCQPGLFPPCSRRSRSHRGLKSPI